MEDLRHFLKFGGFTITVGGEDMQSKRFRDILWKLQEQRLGRAPTEEEFAKYYKSEYEKICNHYLNKFDDVGNI